MSALNLTATPAAGAPRREQLNSRRLLLVGAGRMGLAMLRGWLGQGLRADSVSVVDPWPTIELDALASEHGIAVNDAGLPRAEVVVMAVKPQVADDVARQVSGHLLKGGLVISIMAGTTMADLAHQFPQARGIVRAMPNLAATVGRATTVAVASDRPRPRDIVFAEALFSAIGDFHWLPGEQLLNAATAISGAGPAYFFYLVECLTAAGIHVGLSNDVAEALARSTLEGSGLLLGRSGLPAGELRANVTSPGGVTQAGLSMLMTDYRLQKLMIETVVAAKNRAAELGR